MEETKTGRKERRKDKRTRDGSKVENEKLFKRESNFSGLYGFLFCLTNLCFSLASTTEMKKKYAVRAHKSPQTRSHADGLCK